jgi:hypothetical protein
LPKKYGGLGNFAASGHVRRAAAPFYTTS